MASDSGGTRWVILTGASRGLGQALAQQLLSAGAPATRLLTLSRQPDASLHALTPHALTQWGVDLSDAAELEATAQRLSRWLAEVPAPDARPTQLLLINNAARLAPAVPLEACPPGDLAQTLTLGLHAPMRLCAAVLAQAARWRDDAAPGATPVDVSILNLSSGLGRRPMAAQSPYCAVKAGMDLFSRCVALEQAALPHAARIVALAPGVIDTAMQTELRSGDPAQFPDRERFVQLHTQAQLDSPAACAAKILRFVDSAGFGEKVIADIRDDAA